MMLPFLEGWIPTVQRSPEMYRERLTRFSGTVNLLDSFVLVVPAGTWHIDVREQGGLWCTVTVNGYTDCETLGIQEER
jgi:hypothetical protein